MTMKELAERCEQATGPDRLLDGEIWREAHGLTIYDVLTPEGEISVSVPYLTASLDAAMTLVPEGRGLIYKRHGIKNVWRVQIHSGDETTFIEGDAATPALALCAAALKARASQETTR
jgi:hypothetical protein